MFQAIYGVMRWLYNTLLMVLASIVLVPAVMAIFLTVLLLFTVFYKCFRGGLGPSVQSAVGRAADLTQGKRLSGC